MKTLDLIYVTSGRHPRTEEIICKATDSIYSHAAVGIEIDGVYSIVEAVRPVVQIVPGDYFEDAVVKQVISFEITNEQHQAILKRIQEVIGTPYGIDDCIIGGLHDLIGDTAAELADKLIGNNATYNCSGLQVDLMRQAFVDFAGSDPGYFITPEQARQFAIEYKGRNN